MKNKKILIMVGVFILGVSIGYFLGYNMGQMQTETDADDVFSKKQDCQKLQLELEGRLDEMYSGPAYRSANIDEIFYSPVKNTCLYTYNVSEKGVFGRPSSYLRDALTNEVLVSKILSGEEDIVYASELRESFQEIVDMYKNPNTKAEDLPEKGETLM